MKIKQWPKNERPREKLLTKGPEALSDAELLAILLQTGTPNKTALDLAKELINTFGNLNNLLNSEQKTLLKTQGLGPAKFAALHTAYELGKRTLQENILDKDVLNNATVTKQFLISKLKDKPHEVFACLFLNSKNQLIKYEELAHGTINESIVYPREVVKRALYHNAHAVIFAHNHPSGDPTPSQSDIELTKNLTNFLDTINIKVHDHIIIGESKCYSFAQSGS